MPRSIRLSREATDDLLSIAGWVTREAGPLVANRYADAIRTRCETLADFPSRGTIRSKRGDIRSIPFRRSATIIYRITRREVVILRVLHRGRDVEREVRDPL